MTIETQKTLLPLALGDTSNWSFTGTESKVAFHGGPYWVEVLVTWVEQDWMVEVWEYHRKILETGRKMLYPWLSSVKVRCLFTRACNDSSRGSGFRPKGDRFRWDAGKQFLPCGWWDPITGYPITKSVQGRAGWGLEEPDQWKMSSPQSIPSNPNYSMILTENTRWKYEKQTECM